MTRTGFSRWCQGSPIIIMKYSSKHCAPGRKKGVTHSGPVDLNSYQVSILSIQKHPER